METKKQALKEGMRRMFQQMAEGKREVSEYIQQHGTINGYSGKVKFVRPF